MRSDQNSRGRGCLAYAEPGAEGGEAQRDPPIGQASEGGCATDPAIGFDLQVQNRDP